MPDDNSKKHQNEQERLQCLSNETAAILNDLGLPKKACFWAVWVANTPNPSESTVLENLGRSTVIINNKPSKYSILGVLYQSIRAIIKCDGLDSAYQRLPTYTDVDNEAKQYDTKIPLWTEFEKELTSFSSGNTLDLDKSILVNTILKFEQEKYNGIIKSIKEIKDNMISTLGDVSFENSLPILSSGERAIDKTEPFSKVWLEQREDELNN
ncbi:hypothetical protein [Shewanella algae]|uniref:hypothetical protein n=1 Tax=Shewanella algae TaxID=38313 RepID=UPI00313D388C